MNLNKMHNLTAIKPVLIVKDIDLTLEFYKTKLGFEVEKSDIEGETSGYAKRDQFCIEFIQSQTGSVPLNRDFSRVGYDLRMCIPANGVYCSELKEAGVKIVEDIAHNHFGTRYFSFEDIDGHWILVED